MFQFLYWCIFLCFYSVYIVKLKVESRLINLKNYNYIYIIPDSTSNRGHTRHRELFTRPIYFSFVDIVFFLFGVNIMKMEM